MLNSNLFKIFLIAISGFFLISCEEEKIQYTPAADFIDWQPIYLNIIHDLYDIHFVDSNTGWIVGEDQTLISTASGSLGWVLSPVGYPLENLRGVYFIDELNGWMVGDLDGNPVQGQVAYSNNGGGYPLQQFITDNPLTSVVFINEQTGLAAGENGHVIETLNGGEEWSIIPPFTSNDINDMFFTEPLNGWAVTSNGGIFRTQNGTDWEEDSTGITTDLLAIHFVDENHGWACGHNNTILKQEIEGDQSNWTRITIIEEPSDMVWNDIFFIDQFTGWVIGERGTVYKTEDAGANWKAEESSVSKNLNALYMVGPKKGWIVGDDGTILSYSPRE